MLASKWILPKTLQTYKFFQKPIVSAQIRSLSTVQDLLNKKKMFYINMPTIMDDRDGRLEKWVLQEGQSFQNGDVICELAFPSMSIGFDSDHPGILAEKLAREGERIPIEKPIALAAINKDAYFEYIDLKRAKDLEDEKSNDAGEIIQEKSKKPDSLVLLREIKHLIQEGHIQDGSEFAKKLQALARKNDSSLMNIFQASYDGVAFDKDSFDVKFFIENTEALVKEQQD